MSGNFVQRNKMTVRGGSAFNSLQRALKQDLLDSGAAQRNPEVGKEEGGFNGRRHFVFTFHGLKAHHCLV